MPPTPQAQVEAACLRPDGSVFSVRIPLRSLAVKGTTGIAECGERLAQQLSFGHFGVPGEVMPPSVRLSDVPGVSVMVLQLRNPARGFLLAVRPSKSLPPFPENIVANRMLNNKQLHVFGCAIFVRHDYVAQTSTNSYLPIGISEAKALIAAVPGSEALVAEAQRLATARKAERELAEEFSARPLAASALAAADSGQNFSMRSFGMPAAKSAASPQAAQSMEQHGRTGGTAFSATGAYATQASEAHPQSNPRAMHPNSRILPGSGHAAKSAAAPRAQQSPPQPCRTREASACSVSSGCATRVSAGHQQAARVVAQPSRRSMTLPDPCPICANTYQVTHHIRQKASCCKQRVCSECSTEILKRAGFAGRSPCPCCRHTPLQVQDSTSDSEDENEVEAARQARMAEDHQLAQVLQGIEDEGMASFASRLGRQRSQAQSQASGKTWVSVAQEGRVRALEAEVAQLKSLLGARQMPGSRSAGPSPSVLRPSGPSLSGSSFKTVLCRYHQVGRCSKGSACSYAHGAGELQAASASSTSTVQRHPANYKTVLCEFFERGSCRYGAQCTFAHGSGDLRASASGPNRASSASSAVKNWLAARSLCCQAGLGTRVSRSMEGQTEIAAWRRRLQDAKSRRQPFSFPPSLSAADRKVIHVLCDELGIRHESRGEGASRCIYIFFDSDAPDSISDFAGEIDALEYMGHSEPEEYDDFYDHYDLDDDFFDEE